MDDFASAAMLRLLLRAMLRRGLDLPMPVPEGGTVPLAAKRLLLGHIARQHGPARLLDLAQDLDAVQGEPLHQVLTGARDLDDLLRRWQRLEQYVHSAHRVVLLHADGDGAELLHAARRPGDPPPHPFENLVVLGVLCGALRRLVAGPLALALDGVALPAGADAASPDPLGALIAAGRTARWRFGWQGMAVNDARTRPAGCPPDLCDALGWPAPARLIARKVVAEGGAGQRLDCVARELGLAPRTLQRMLARDGLSLTAIVAEARVRAAAWWLLNTEVGLAEIGYLCGFCDQPHFTRDFLRRVGLTPARYREAGGADARLQVLAPLRAVA